jgi:RND family efflux transporter MFP subunit
MKFRAWMLLPLLAAAGAGGYAWVRNRPLVVELAHPHRGPAVLAVYATGVVEPTIDVPIAPRVAGKLVELRVDEGAHVRRGQVLARLEDANLQHGIEQLAAQEQYAKQALDRQETILARGLGAQADRDRALAEWRAAHAATDKAREEQGFMVLRSPADGLVIRRDGEVGQFIAVNQVVFHVAASASLRISADVDEEDIPLVARGQKVLVRADAFPQQVFAGSVLEVTPRGDASTRSYRVRIGIPADAPLRVGMTADTNIVVEQHEGALLVPASAVKGGKAWVVRNGRAALVPIKPGIAGEREIEVQAGLVEGDAVLVSPPDALREGRRVRAR